MNEASREAWETYEHGADVGVRGFGRTPAEAFANAATALTAVVADPQRVRPRECCRLSCRAPDLETLFIDWLNALVLEMNLRRSLFVRFEVAIVDLVLEATVWGEPLDRQRHQPAVEVKGATWTTARVVQGPDGRWLAQCVVDV